MNSMKLKLNYNLILLFILILNVKDISNEEIKYISHGEMYIEYLNNSKGVELEWNNDYYPLIINFLSIDCEINIEIVLDSYEKNRYTKISNYNYEVYYFPNLIAHNIKFKIYPIIPSLNEKNKNRNCPLIINSISRRGCLKIKENIPIFFYFINSNYKEICLKYEYENSYNEQPIIVSFFTKEKVVFNVEIDDNNNNNIIDRDINYKENILFKPDSSKKTYIFYINYYGEMEINPTLSFKISQNNSTPLYLQKDQLNSGFLPIGLNFYYYYMEVFKGEEGEIILFNKWQNGRLISKILKRIII